MQDEKAASVWPYLKLKRSFSNTDSTLTMSVEYENRGVGSALLQVDYSIDGKAEASTLKIIRQIIDGNPDLEPTTFVANDIKRVVIRPNETLTAYSVTIRHNNSAATIGTLTALAMAQLGEIKTVATYCSIYGDCWAITSDTGDVPQPCTDCGEELKI